MWSRTRAAAGVISVAGEVAAGGQGVGVVVAEDPAVVGEQPLELVDCVGRTALRVPKTSSVLVMSTLITG